MTANTALAERRAGKNACYVLDLLEKNQVTIFIKLTEEPNRVSAFAASPLTINIITVAVLQMCVGTRRRVLLFHILVIKI